jgi:hypothetical protein
MKVFEMKSEVYFKTTTKYFQNWRQLLQSIKVERLNNTKDRQRPNNGTILAQGVDRMPRMNGYVEYVSTNGSYHSTIFANFFKTRSQKFKAVSIQEALRKFAMRQVMNKLEEERLKANNEWKRRQKNKRSNCNRSNQRQIRIFSSI